MIRTIAAMGTIVTIETPGEHPANGASDEPAACVARAFAWVHEVEARCTRFDPDSELMRLTTQVGTPVVASDILFEAVRFAVAVADASAGAFDPAVGHQMEQRGFNRDYRTGRIVGSGRASAPPASYRDIDLDPARQTITLRRPLILDLGAVAKGLAIDLAAQALRPLTDFAIDAGGDLYLGGSGPAGGPWRVGLRHPRADDGILRTISVSDRAVCTSGDYERPAPDGGAGHHLLDPRSGACAGAAASATVIAPTAMAADALATAAFVLGPVAGVRLLERQGVEGVIVSAQLEQHATRGFGTTFGGAAILQNAQRLAAHRSSAAGRRRRGERRRQADDARTA